MLVFVKYSRCPIPSFCIFVDFFVFFDVYSFSVDVMVVNVWNLFPFVFVFSFSMGIGTRDLNFQRGRFIRNSTRNCVFSARHSQLTRLFYQETGMAICRTLCETTNSTDHCDFLLLTGQAKDLNFFRRQAMYPRFSVRIWFQQLTSFFPTI